MMTNSRLHQNRMMSEIGLFFLKFNQKKVPLRVMEHLRRKMMMKLMPVLTTGLAPITPYFFHSRSRN
ncbi:Hypothetical protein FKW44_020630 [Caligus rogercresseyi]|nr:Hypothetical protein FKW44_020630 [Caligus rogercresseyi]